MSSPTNTPSRSQSIAKLNSPLSNTPATISQLSAMYKHKNSSSSASSMHHETNPLSSTPNSRKQNLTSILRSTSPAIEFDDDQVTTQPDSAYGSFVDDPTILKNVSKHLPTDANNALKLPSGDITRDFYHLSQPQTIKRSKSFTSQTADDRRGSVASQMRLPGGFRREFLQTKKQKFGYTLSQPTNLTKSFLEFLTIYGHFAGEDLEDEDFLACDYDTSDIKQDEESPLLSSSQDTTQGKAEKKTSSLKAFFLLIKAFVGTGILFLPKAFYNGGLIFSIVLLVFFSILSYYCYLTLSHSTALLGVSSFAEMGNKMYGNYLKSLILISIILTQIGFVAAYTVFTAENLRAFIRNTFDYDLPLHYFVIFETICFAPMSLIRNITKLSLAALLANVFILSGIATIVFYAAKDLIKNGPAEVKYFNSSDWSLFIGVAIFAFEGIGLIIPVQQSMKHPEDFPKVLLAVISLCCFLFIGIGWLCYQTYGDDVQTMVILNLPQDSYAVVSIQFFYALAIMLSVPLQLLPAIRLMESRIFKKLPSGKVDSKTKWYKNIFRIFVTLITTTIAYFGSANLDLFVSFIGSFACIPLVYMYPPMIHVRASNHNKWIKILDWSIIVVGGFALVFTTALLFI